MAFDFSGMMSRMGQNFGQNTAGMRGLPMDQKLLATANILHGGSPDFAAMIRQFGGQGGGQAPATVPGQNPVTDMAAKVSSDLGAQSGLPPDAAQKSDDDPFGGLLGMGAGALMKSPYGLLGMLAGGKGGGFGFGGGGLLSLLGKK
jgi:hypothetical protein